MAYATYQDVEARWRDLTADEQTKCSTLLDDAAAMLDTMVTVNDSDEAQAYLLKVVSCNMVIRSMVASESTALGVDQLSATMGPFGQTAHFANPNGDLYLTRQERDMLGIGWAFIGDMRAAIDGHYGTNLTEVADG